VVSGQLHALPVQMRLAEVKNSEKGYFCTPLNPYHNAICVVKEEASKFAPHTDNTKFSTHDEERIRICTTLPAHFYTPYAIKM
jgi:hypothetical protein